MNDKTSSDVTVSSASASKSDRPSVGREAKASKVDTSDENFEHTLRRAVREKDKRRTKKPGLYL
jgi:hypothetical protein